MASGEMQGKQSQIGLKAISHSPYSHPKYKREAVSQTKAHKANTVKTAPRQRPAAVHDQLQRTSTKDLDSPCAEQCCTTCFVHAACTGSS